MNDQGDNPDKQFFEAAAQCWCQESTKHLEMIPELAMVFALTLKNWYVGGREEGKDYMKFQLNSTIEQLRVQLAGCGVAAMCNTEQSREQQKCIEGDYGWSQSYQDVVNVVGREIHLREVLDKIAKVASGEDQVTDDDTECLAWIQRYIAASV